MKVRTATAAACGILATALGGAAAHLVASLVSPSASPVLAVGGQVINLTPTPVKEWAVSTFGTADKPILIGSVIIVTLLLAALAGLLRLRSRAAAVAVLVLLTALAGAAAVLRPETGSFAWLPALVAAVVGVATLELLVSRTSLLRPDHAVPGEPTRRGVLALGGAGVGAAALGVGGQTLIHRRAPTTITLPPAVDPLPPLAKGADLGKAGIAPFVTPAKDFYRIDTALLVPKVDPRDWSLTIDGDVPDPFTIDLDELLAMPAVERDITLNCVSNPVGGPYIGNARWLGVLTRELFARAGLEDDSRDPDLQVLSTSTDGMTISTPLTALLDDRDALVAVGMNGEPLAAERGFPARLLTPRLYGFVGATKWLTRMTVTRYDEQSAYWTERGWATDGTVKTQSRIDTPAPLARLDPGRTTIGGVAWAQGRGIKKVEVRVDDGPWQRATLGAEADIDCWRQWFLPWDATDGRHDLTVRATDRTGAVQTTDTANPFPSGATGLHSLAVTVG
ncbi:molybdopterin-dependent oxidoreductase [Janibacter cremeus]|uniref:DMSO/TMAO reductase YedYZ molybdopterin-dependent catalytic subunit n=1 Tax=Janibacter cremeus TaxID=1285192 RepID=A0A852VZZ3_9MICO|nr:molybdopterin-dependent oxidoreductase [Janibacter cremeus]NYF99011.1 DMSO/TMAO reductase YedYZ molybdopterin-dependent catalytic subunit [Janibacter cremeus]